MAKKENKALSASVLANKLSQANKFGLITRSVIIGIWHRFDMQKKQRLAAFNEKHGLTPPAEEPDFGDVELNAPVKKGKALKIGDDIPQRKSRPRSFMDLERNECRWIGDDELFCANRVVAGKSYCPAHMKRAYRGFRHAETIHKT